MDELKDLIDAMSRQQQIAFAADCAEHVLHLVSDESRAACENAIRVARWCAAGANLRHTAHAAYAAADNAANATYATYAERQWRTQRAREYLRGEVPLPAMPAIVDLKALLLHTDPCVRVEAIRALGELAGLDNSPPVGV